MIKISKNTKVYILCPANIVTGGAELLHQLAHVLNNGGQEAYIYYYSKPEAQLPEAYVNYNIRITREIADEPQNVVVLYEAIFDWTRKVRHGQLLLWWLSVDHFYMYSKQYLALTDYMRWKMKDFFRVFVYRAGMLLLYRKNFFFNSISLKKLAAMNALHCYQSEYAQHFLYSNGFSEVLPLTDYINTDFGNARSAMARENKILYNPKKGMKFTRRLMDAAPHLKWIALENMTRAQLINELQTAKVYIDFGYHPGKDRIPREAALNGCCVITNREGSAGFFEDVCLSDYYKVDNCGITHIIDRLENIMNNYGEHTLNFDLYRQRIAAEELDFIRQVNQVFNLDNH